MSSIKKVIVVGSGIAALSFAKTISKSYQVIMMTKNNVHLVIPCWHKEESLLPFQYMIQLSSMCKIH
nr:hypothetical protein [Bacillus safensis]